MKYWPHPSYYMVGSILYFICILFVYNIYFILIEKIKYGLHPSYYMVGSILYLICIYFLLNTRSSGRSAPLLLALAEGSGALRAPRALRALLGAFAPS